MEKELEHILKNDLFPAEPETDPKKLCRKVPTIAIMGHVDHGKTTLLDYLRSSFVADNEAGGITQHIGAFNVSVLDEKMTVLDTPGHAAFHAIRERGATVVDQIILVVAADDGVMPQTIQSVKFAKKSNTPVMFVITKMDKKDANVEHVKGSISAHFNTDEIYPISAKTGKNVPEMLMFLHDKVTELDLKASVVGHPEGHVLEVKNQPGIGLVITVLVSRGKFKPGQTVISGSHVCKVKALYDEQRKKVKEAGPGEFVQLAGFKTRPAPGGFIQGADKSTATRAKAFREEESRKQYFQQFNIQNDTSERIEFDKAVLQKKIEMGFYRLEKSQQLFFTQMMEKKRLDDHEIIKASSLHFIIKGDVSGSVEAIVDAIGLYEAGDDEPLMNIINFDVGPINANDIKEAHTADPKLQIINFNQPISPNMTAQAQKLGIKIYNSSIIYELMDAIEADLADLMPLDNFDAQIGEAEVVQVFQKKINPNNKKEGAVAGCRIVNGTMRRSDQIEIYRKGSLFYSCMAAKLFYKSDEVDEVTSNEFGCSFDWAERGFLPGDVLKCFSIESARRDVNWEWS